MNVVVVGSGVVGAAIAYRVAEAGARVLVLDAGLPGCGTSGASFACLNAFEKTPRDYFDLNVAGMAEHNRLLDELAPVGGAWLHQTGGLHWANTDVAQATLTSTGERLVGWGYPAEWLTPAQVCRELEPGLQLPSDQRDILFTPTEGWVDVLPLIDALLHAATQHGAEVRPLTRVVGIDTRGGTVQSVRLEEGERIAAEVVVDCAGPLADEIADLAGLRVPLDRIPGLLAISAPLTNGPRRVCRAQEVHFRPDGGGRIMVGEEYPDEHISVGSRAKSAAELLAWAAAYLPSLRSGQLEATRIGVRPMPRDGYPMVGFLPGIEGLYLAVAHSGVTLAPLLARVAAAEIVSHRSDARLSAYRPGRFARTVHWRIR